MKALDNRDHFYWINLFPHCICTSRGNNSTSLSWCGYRLFFLHGMNNERVKGGEERGLERETDRERVERKRGKIAHKLCTSKCYKN